MCLSFLYIFSLMMVINGQTTTEPTSAPSMDPCNVRDTPDCYNHTYPPTVPNVTHVYTSPPSPPCHNGRCDASHPAFAGTTMPPTPVNYTHPPSFATTLDHGRHATATTKDVPESTLNSAPPTRWHDHDTNFPSMLPTKSPTFTPTWSPLPGNDTRDPTPRPTLIPSLDPTVYITNNPTTGIPTLSPSELPTDDTSSPTYRPTNAPFAQDQVDDTTISPVKITVDNQSIMTNDNGTFLSLTGVLLIIFSVVLIASVGGTLFYCIQRKKQEKKKAKRLQLHFKVKKQMALNRVKSDSCSSSKRKNLLAKPVPNEGILTVLHVQNNDNVYANIQSDDDNLIKHKNTAGGDDEWSDSDDNTHKKKKQSMALEMGKAQTKGGIVVSAATYNIDIDTIEIVENDNDPSQSNDNDPDSELIANVNKLTPAGSNTHPSNIEYDQEIIDDDDIDDNNRTAGGSQSINRSGSSTNN